MLQQVGGQVVESLNQSRARSCPVLRTKRMRAGFDLVKQARYLAMIGHQPVHHRTKRGIRAPESRKESDVLGMMVSMHKAAMIEAVDAQFPKRTAGLERLYLLTNIFRRHSGCDLSGKFLAEREILTKHVVNPFQLLQQVLPGFPCLRVILDALCHTSIPFD